VYIQAKKYAPGNVNGRPRRATRGRPYGASVAT
jgi:hypothetical protein